MAVSKTTTPAVVGADDSSEQVVSLYRAQTKIYARAVTGWFATWRWVLVWATQLLFYGLPWLHWGERQAVLFDLEARRFYIFNLVLYPQDFIFLTALLIISAYSLFLFTAVAGRLWCGFACPQTVYTEIFMWVERHLEGDRPKRMKLDAGPWNLEKIWRKGGKQLIWVSIALWTGFTFVGYFTPIQTLAAEFQSLTVGPWEIFWVLFYGLATYGFAGFMREQVCKYMCPYARFQSVMFDKDTLIISYDAERGEPRGTRGRKTDLKVAGLGSCIDCGLCVQVCPTGIDIREGLQYECIGCAACIDVCDTVMDKMQYPRGLIRYDTQNGLQRHLGRQEVFKRILRPRVLVYTAILGVLCFAFLWGLATRDSFKVNVVRDRGALARLVDNGWIENVYRLQIMNATEQPQRFRIQPSGMEGITVEAPLELVLQPAEARWVPVAARIPPQVAESAGPGSHPVQFVVDRLEIRQPAGGTAAPTAGGAAETVLDTLREKSTFIVPR